MSSAVFHLVHHKTSGPPYLLPRVELPPLELTEEDYPVDSRDAQRMFGERQHAWMSVQHRSLVHSADGLWGPVPPPHLAAMWPTIATLPSI